MVNHNEVSIKDIFLVYNGHKVIDGIIFQTSKEGLSKAEQILRDNPCVVDELSTRNEPRNEAKIGLVYEPRGPNTGIAHFHLRYLDFHLGPNLYVHHWVDKMTEEDFRNDQIEPLLRKIYTEIKPTKITTYLQNADCRNYFE